MHLHISKTRRSESFQKDLRYRFNFRCSIALGKMAPLNVLKTTFPRIPCCCFQTLVGRIRVVWSFAPYSILVEWYAFSSTTKYDFNNYIYRNATSSTNFVIFPHSNFNFDEIFRQSTRKGFQNLWTANVSCRSSSRCWRHSSYKRAPNQNKLSMVSLPNICAGDLILVAQNDFSASGNLILRWRWV